MTIINIDKNIIEKSPGTNNSGGWSENFSMIDNNRSVINSPNYCTTCHGGGCARCTPIN